MKAKEYARQYRELFSTVGQEMAIWTIVKDFFLETKAIAEARHSDSNLCLIAVLKEQSQKWRVFVRLAGDAGLRPDGFYNFVLKQFAHEPEVLRDFSKHGFFR
jgi:hypothetical protein